MGLIYGARLIGDTQIRYVGQTSKTLARRSSQHFAYVTWGSEYPIYRWMRKHGVENVEFILLEDEIPDDILDDRECYWIEYYGTFGPGGLNCDGGGRSRRGFTVPQDVRDKISASLKGREFSDETRAKISAKKAGENHHFYGKKMSEEFSRKLSERSRGEGNPRALLKETDVVAIIARLATGEKYGPIAADYSVGRHVIGYIYRGVTWKYIERPWNV